MYLSHIVTQTCVFLQNKQAIEQTARPRSKMGHMPSAGSGSKFCPQHLRKTDTLGL